MTDETEVPAGESRRGSEGPAVRRIQEWLCLHGFHVVIDGQYGPATESAVRSFQGAGATGVVGTDTFERLISPMTSARQAIDPRGMSLGALVVRYAEQHLAQAPREVGGQNRGPWVRLYMGGREGDQWPWCAGFACFCLRAASDRLALQSPIGLSLSCDSLAASARHHGLLVQGAASPPPGVGPGALFLHRRTDSDWTHTGIVRGTDAEVFHTIEGNTNDDGSREGYEVCARRRGYGPIDFIRI